MGAEDFDERISEGIFISCPQCSSEDVIVETDGKGYFWINICNECGFNGHSGEKTIRRINPSGINSLLNY